MRFLYLCPDDGIPVLGVSGGAVHVREMIAALARQGHLAILAAPVDVKSPDEVPARLDAEFVRIAPSAATLEAVAGLRAFLGRTECKKSAARCVRRMLYDNDLAQALFERFADDPPDFIYCRVALLSTAAARFARATGSPLLVEVNAPLSTEQAAYRDGDITEIAMAAERNLLRAADGVLVVSNALVGHVAAMGVSAERIHVQPNAVDPALFRPGAQDLALRRKLGIGPGPLLGFVGGLRPWHGVEFLPQLLARLAQKVPGVQLLVVGEGPMRETMVERLQACGMLARTVFAGAVAHEAIPDHIRLFDIALAPYPRPEHDFYFSPLKLYEYMGCGAPVVAARIGQIPEVVEDECTGLLYAPDDLDALAQACERVLANPKLKRRLGAAAAAHVHAHHTWEQRARRVSALASELKRPALRRFACGATTFAGIPPTFIARSKRARTSTVRRIAYIAKMFPTVSQTFVANEMAEVLRRGAEVRILSLRPAVGEVRHGIVARAGLDRRTCYDADQFSAELADFRPQLLHAHFATEATAVARALARKLGIPYCFTAHGYDIYRKPPGDFPARAEDAAAVITVSEANRSHIAGQFGVPLENVYVVSCGVDTDYFVPGVEESQPPHIICVARLVPVKNHSLLLEACARLRARGVAFRCALIGEGRSRGAVVAERSRLGLEDCVILAGAAEQHEVRAWLRGASVVALSSSCEGMPVSLMEAAACGVPVVATAVGGVPELVVDGETGFVVAAGDAEAFADRLQRLLAAPELRAHMGLRARARALERFSLVRQVDLLTEIWDRALATARDTVVESAV